MQTETSSFTHPLRRYVLHLCFSPHDPLEASRNPNTRGNVCRIYVVAGIE
jgi:hypothetical protein